MKGSGLAMVKQIKSDLVSYVQTSVADASIAVSGHWPNRMFAGTVADPVTPVLSTSTYQKMRQRDRSSRSRNLREDPQRERIPREPVADQHDDSVWPQPALPDLAD